MASAGPQTDSMISRNGDGQAVLLGGFSEQSQHSHFPRALVCPYTGANDVVDYELPSTGVLWACTVVNSAPPGYFGPVPYGFGVVQLKDGLRILTRIAADDPVSLQIGQPMRLIIEDLPAGADQDAGTMQIWAFAPTSDDTASDDTASDDTASGAR